MKKNLKISEKFFSSNFQKKGLNCSVTKGRKSNSYGPPKEKIWKKFFLAVFRKKVSIVLNWKKVSIMMNFSLFEMKWWFLEKKSENIWKFFLAIFRKKGLKLIWIERKCPLWWIWAYLRWIDNFWKKKKSKTFSWNSSFGVPKEESQIRMVPQRKKSEIFFSSIFKKKVNWKKVSIYDEFELVWDELIILEKKSEKNLKIFF